MCPHPSLLPSFGREKELLRNHPLRIVLPLTLLLFLSGGSLYYWRSTSVRLTSDGQTRRIFTKAHDLKGFLTEQHIKFGPNDLIAPALESPIGHNTAVKITRVTIATEVQVSTSAPVVKWQNRTRENLRRVMAQRGYSEVLHKQIRVIKHDGIEVSRVVISKKKSRRPFYNLILFNKRGQPAKKYNLLKCRMLRMRSTGYYVGEKTVPSDTTFLGHKLQRGLVAVDPNVIPLGTRLYVDGYGYAYAADTGSAIKGLRIDLAISGQKEEDRFNRYDVPVYLLEKSSYW
jgi:3D (Asp-Asp-Asp) domain-containing protein